MRKSLHSFVDRTRFRFELERLPGYPELVPGHLLVSDVIARPVKSDVELLLSIFGTGQIRSVLQHLVEKGRIDTVAREFVGKMLAAKEPDGNLYRTL